MTLSSSPLVDRSCLLKHQPHRRGIQFLCTSLSGQNNNVVPAIMHARSPVQHGEQSAVHPHCKAGVKLERHFRPINHVSSFPNEVFSRNKSGFATSTGNLRCTHRLQCSRRLQSVQSFAILGYGETGFSATTITILRHGGYLPRFAA